MPKCPYDGTELEFFQEPDLDGDVWSFFRCSKCGFEVGGQTGELSAEEYALCHQLRHLAKSRAGASSALSQE